MDFKINESKKVEQVTVDKDSNAEINEPGTLKSTNVGWRCVPGHMFMFSLVVVSLYCGVKIGCFAAF